MRTRVPSLLISSALAFSLQGCAARLSDDNVRLDDLAPEERAAVEQDRRHQLTGGRTALVEQPRFVYLNGALVDTNRARWYWIAGGTIAPPAPPAPLPEAP